jgi:uncharacterized membrane protein
VDGDPSNPRDPEPRWQAAIAVLAVAGVYVALPASLTLGPGWLFPAIVFALLVPLVFSHQAGRHRLNHALGLIVATLLTMAMMASVFLLIRALPAHQESAPALLLSAASLWFTNVLVFALWYWRLDAGGPNRRDARVHHSDGAFLFPQMTLPADVKAATNQRGWSPHFLDYLFLAFNTSTALSPTDTPVLKRWAKTLVMVQSIISLTVLAVLAARAVNSL